MNMKIAGPEKSISEVVAMMHERIAAGCDPLTGRPFLIVGKVTACDDGTCRDEAGTEVTLSEHGDWVPTCK